MKTITVQTRNIDLEIKEQAEIRARELGFSSMQDVIRVFLKDFAEGSITAETAWKYDQILSRSSNIKKNDDEVMAEVIGEIKDYRKSEND